MRLGVSTYAFPRAVAAGRMDVDGLLDWAQTKGVGTVQFCENLPWPLGRPAPEGLVIETGCRGIGDHLLDHLELAQRHGSGFVRLVVENDPDRPDEEEAVERLRPYVARYREAGVVLAIENHERFTSHALRAIVVDLGTDAAGIVLDTANSLGRLESLAEVVQTLGPYVVNLHAKDVRAVRKPDMLGFDIEGTIFGKGAVNLPEILPSLPRLQSVTLEQWVPGSVEREMDWASTSLRNLREELLGWADA